MRLGARVTLQAYRAALSNPTLCVPDTVRSRLRAARKVVDDAMTGDAPVYGLNTGLGANLGHKIAPADIAAFQRQLIEGRAVAVGPNLPDAIGRGMLLARLIGVAQGHSGMSLPMFDHLCTLWQQNAQLAVPQHGSIGAADLTQNACWALAVLETGAAPPLQAKDGMALINHSGLSVARAGAALFEAQIGLQMAQHAALLSCQGFGANPQIFAPSINRLRPAPGQAEMAAWFARHLTTTTAGRVQDALSFRTIAPVFGAALDAVQRAIAIWEDELNGASDNPAVLERSAMCSTPNFSAPALALALEQVSLSMAMLAQSMVMRLQRMMDPALSGLPKYLSPVGGASAGFVPLQKTAMALLSDIRRHAAPVVLDAPPVSDGVEDMAPMTPQAAAKLADQMQAFHLLCGCEAVVAAQACDLRGLTSVTHNAVRAHVPMLQEDRPLGADAQTARDLLRRKAAEDADGP